MASGKKNYFRHSFQAGNDPKIIEAIDRYGKETYFHYFRLLELCGEQAEYEVPTLFVFHPRTLCENLLVKRNKLGTHLVRLQNVALINVELSDNRVELQIPNFAKYLGRYSTKKQPNTPNKIKENKIKLNKIKGKEIKEKATYPPKVQEVIDAWNNNRDKLPAIRAVSATRKKKIQTRLKDFPEIETWVEAINKLAESDFCNGLNDRSWVASFNFLLQPESIPKILEGVYDNRKHLSKRDINFIKVQQENPFNEQ